MTADEKSNATREKHTDAGPAPPAPEAVPLRPDPSVIAPKLDFVTHTADDSGTKRIILTPERRKDAADTPKPSTEDNKDGDKSSA